MAYQNWRVGLLAIIAGAALAGCLPEVKQPTTRAPAEETPNSAPSISGIPGTAATAGVAWQFQPSASDADGDTLAFSASGLPGWVSLDFRTGRVSGTPSESDVGTTSAITISVSDGEASASLPAFSVTVASAAPPPPPPPPTNTRPTITGSPALTVQATSPYSFTPMASDAETPQSLSFAIINRPSWASFSTSTGRLSGTPAANQAGTYANIVISVTDGSLTAALPAFTITVTAAPNRAPVISGSPAGTATAGVAYSFQPSASDPDGQTLTYSISNRPAWASFNSATGRLSGTPGSGNVGTFSNIVISVSDGSLSASLPAFSITVAAAPNRAPVISGTPVTSATVGTAYSFQPTASDPDGQTLAYSISNKPGWASFSTSTGRLSGTPAAGDVGSFPNIVITVTDTAEASASLAAFSITVAAAPTQNGTAQLSWTAPTQNTDGSSLTNLAGYFVYYGRSEGSLDERFEISGANTTSFEFTSLASGMHYFAVSAFNADRVESALSAVGSKSIP